jgi:regulatory protein
MLVSSLHQTSPGRFLVTLEDGTEIRSTLAVVTDQRIYTGRELDEEALAAFRAASSLERTKNRAAELLSLRPMSCKELYDKLVQKGEPEQNAAAAVAWLLENRFLDDRNYAGMVVRHYAAKGYGPGRIRNELFRRGVPRELWEEALEELPEQDDEIDRLLRKKLRGDVSDRDALRKATDYLYRRGFKHEDIRAAVERLRMEEGEDW